MKASGSQELVVVLVACGHAALAGLAALGGFVGLLTASV